RTDPDEPDHARADDLPRSQVPEVLDHPSHRDRWRRHAGAQRLYRRRTIHRSTAGVLCSRNPACTGSGCGPTRRSRRERWHGRRDAYSDGQQRRRKRTPVAGTLVKVTADMPPAGKQFARWSGDTDILANPFIPTTTATMPSIDVTITATYADKK